MPHMEHSEIITAAVDIARRRRAVLDQMREAFEHGDDDKALKLARNLCGLNNEKSNRVN
jgi:hypothetical protein